MPTNIADSTHEPQGHMIGNGDLTSYRTHVSSLSISFILIDKFLIMDFSTSQYEKKVFTILS